MSGPSISIPCAAARPPWARAACTPNCFPRTGWRSSACPPPFCPAANRTSSLAWFAGETIGTWVRPEQRTVSRRKYWLAYQADPQGTLYLDTGAADAVRNHGKSLLPGGITEVHGSFEAGALVRLVYDRETVGVGLSNYNAADLLRIRGLKRHEVAAILGDAHYPEVVHRDNLLLDAAL